MKNILLTNIRCNSKMATMEDNQNWRWRETGTSMGRSTVELVVVLNLIAKKSGENGKIRKSLLDPVLNPLD
jgi:hypothetical protein